MKKNNTGTGEVPAAEKRKPRTPKAESEALRKESRKNRPAEKKPVRQGKTPVAPVLSDFPKEFDIVFMKICIFSDLTPSFKEDLPRCFQRARGNEFQCM